jgi:2-methylcitrate dehydratase PrpD
MSTAIAATTHSPRMPDAGALSPLTGVATTGTLTQVASLATDTLARPAPPEVRHASRRCLIDWLGVAIAGWSEPPARTLREVLLPSSVAKADDALDAPDFAALLSTVSPDQAALVLGTASHALDYDDTDYVNLIHVSSTLFPALLALSSRHRLHGATLLDVFNAAYEAEDRIGAELGRKLTARGWHVSGVIGHVGAALAAGLALKLPVDALAHAMAISATAASGLIGAFGTMSKPLQLARGPADGVLAAQIAQRGFTGAPGLLDADPGFTVPLLGQAVTDWSSVALDWGRPWAVLRNAFKPHASCMITHPVIDAAVALAARVDGATERIARITCHVNALAPKVAGHKFPATGLEGKFSVAYCCVAALVFGRATPDVFAAAHLADPRVHALLQRTGVVTDPAIGEQQARVVVRMDDGRELTQAIAMALGNPGNPMSDADLEAKFRHLTDRALGGRSAAVLDQLHTFERVDDVAAWLRTVRR